MAVATDRTAAEGTARGGLRRELRLIEAVAVSIGLMGPTMAMNLNPVLPASLVGKAVPLVFLLATIGVALVSYGFIRLTQHFNHAGSSYALTGASLGPRAGFFSGWALLGTYTAYTVTTVVGVGIFGETFLQGTGIYEESSWVAISAVAALLVWFLAYSDVRVITRSLLTIEGLSVTLMIIVAVVIFARLLAGNPPDGQTFTLSVFAPEDVPVGTVFLAVVFGFLSFAGFEAAATLGEETMNPRRDIPLAIALTVLFAGLLYTVITTAQAMGFGTSAEGVEAFSTSGALLGDLGESYVGAAMADAIAVGAMISAFGSCLACATAGSRVLFALGRDGFISSRLGAASRRTGAPANALTVVLIAVVLATILVYFFGSSAAIDIFFWSATLGTLPLLVAYIATSLGALVFLFIRGRRARTWEIVIPIAAIAFVVYTLYKNVYPVPDYPYNVFPYMTLGWLAIAVAVIVFVPGLAARIGRHLAEQEGMEVPAGKDEAVARPASGR